MTEGRVYSAEEILKAGLRVIHASANDPIKPESFKREQRNAIFDMYKQLEIESFSRRK